MGYESWCSGGAHVTPPINEKDWPEGDAGYGNDKIYLGYFCLDNVPGDETVTVVNGQLTVVGANPGYTRVDFAWDDGTKMYDIDEKMKALFDWARKHGSEIHGSFIRTGEENGDYQRYRFEGTDYYDESPKIVWPNGDEGI